MIAASIVGLLLLPLVALRGPALWRCYAAGLTMALFAWIAWRRFPSPSSDQARAAFVALVVCELALFALILAHATQVRWSANRAALIAGLVYALVIPATSWKVDGDEPFYLLITESITHDRDLDLANQYRDLSRTPSGRTDLGPQLGDPTGAEGQQYSRHEPFLPLLLVPGYALGGLHGALAVVALFGVLLVRSTVRWMEDEGVPDASVRAVFPFFAFAPPILFYATRLWPEVPAAFFFVEAMRGVRAERVRRWLPALLALVLLKLRFVLVAAGLAVAILRSRRAGWRTMAVLLILGAPSLVVLLISGSPLNVHSWRELVPMQPMSYVRGLCGLLVDGMGGLAFQAPFYLLGLAALLRWREAPRGFRLGILSSLLYLFVLVPRQEAFTNYAPPLRYIVFMLPVLALGAAWIWPRVPRSAIGLFAMWTIGLVIHGIAWPWRLFHEANGENAVGEWLSTVERSDFSRLFPSLARVNEAGWIGAVVIVLSLFWLGGVLARSSSPRSTTSALQLAVVALVLATGYRYGREPASRVEFEDAHVTRSGGHLEPRTGTMNRTAYRAGWVLQEGQSVSFLATAGMHDLHVITGLGATIELEGHAYRTEPDVAHRILRVTIPRTGRVTLRCVSGAVNLDRMELVPPSRGAR